MNGSVRRQPAGAACSAAARAGPSQKRPSFGVRSRQLHLCFIVFRRDGAMGLFLVFFWCAAIAPAVLRYSSRFGVFNSRLGPNKFRFPPRRELAGKGLIYLAVFATKTALMGNNRKNSRLHGNNQEFRPRRNGRWHSLQWQPIIAPDQTEGELPISLRHHHTQSATVLSERARAL